MEKKTNINWNTKKLKTEQTQEIYQKLITEEIEDTQQGYNVNEHWKNIQEAVTKVASQVLDKKRKQRRKWYDDDCKTATEKRNMTRKKCSNTQQLLT